jgi:hypothetical protein
MRTFAIARSTVCRVTESSCTRMTIISLLVTRTTRNSLIWYHFAGLCLIGRLLVVWLDDRVSRLQPGSRQRKALSVIRWRASSEFGTATDITSYRGTSSGRRRDFPQSDF